MTERDLVAVGMDALVPLRLERTPAWDDVLARAGVRPTVMSVARAAPRRRRLRRLVLALTIAVMALAIASAVAAALGQDLFGGLSSWLGGAPGKPAPLAQQNAFAQRNGASYASFPIHTRLRLLDTRRVGGKTFTLLGFRDGGSLCLRLVPTDAPALGGVNECVTLRELQRSPVPAVVASTAYYPNAGGRVAAVFGFADDTVHSVRVTHAIGGPQTVPAINNVFLALHAGPSDPIYDPVVQVTARLRTGASIVLPFTTLGALVQSQVPSYLRYEAVRLPGPTRQEATLPRAEIGWLDRRERRGRSFVPSLKAYGPTSRQVVFARSVQPDPDDAYRIGLAVIRVRHVSQPFEFTWVKRSADARPHRVRLRPGTLLLCSDELFPLRPAPTFNNCVLHAKSSGLFPEGHVLTVNRMYREAFTRVSGLAADGVGEVDLYLASGRVIPAGLRDNAYTVEAPSAQWPAKLVAFDPHGRALGVYPIDSQKSRAVIAPCPTAVATAAPAGAAPPYERLNLTTGTIDGHVVLGHNAASIASALGRPNAYRGQDLLYGLASNGDAAVRIHLAPSGPAARAVWLEVRDPRATDTRIGRVLGMQPIALQQRIAAAYPGPGTCSSLWLRARTPRMYRHVPEPPRTARGRVRTGSEQPRAHLRSSLQDTLRRQGDRGLGDEQHDRVLRRNRADRVPHRSRQTRRCRTGGTPRVRLGGAARTGLGARRLPVPRRRRSRHLRRFRHGFDHDSRHRCDVGVRRRCVVARQPAHRVPRQQHAVRRERRRQRRPEAANAICRSRLVLVTGRQTDRLCRDFRRRSKSTVHRQHGGLPAVKAHRRLDPRRRTRAVLLRTHVVSRRDPTRVRMLRERLPAERQLDLSRTSRWQRPDTRLRGRHSRLVSGRPVVSRQPWIQRSLETLPRAKRRRLRAAGAGLLERLRVRHVVTRQQEDRLQRATSDLRRPDRWLNAPSRRSQPLGVPPVFGLRGRIDDRLLGRRVSPRTHQATVDCQERRLASAGSRRVVHGRVLEPGVAPSPALKSFAAAVTAPNAHCACRAHQRSIPAARPSEGLDVGGATAGRNAGQLANKCQPPGEPSDRPLSHHCRVANQFHTHGAVDQPPVLFDAMPQAGCGVVSRAHQVWPPFVTATASNWLDSGTFVHA